MFQYLVVSHMDLMIIIKIFLQTLFDSLDLHTLSLFELYIYAFTVYTQLTECLRFMAVN